MVRDALPPPNLRQMPSFARRIHAAIYPKREILTAIFGQTHLMLGRRFRVAFIRIALLALASAHHHAAWRVDCAGTGTGRARSSAAEEGTATFRAGRTRCICMLAEVRTAVSAPCFL